MVESARKTRWLRRSSGRRCSPTVRRRSPTHGRASSRAATWGVRIGWLAQTALLIVQAARTDGFPWSTWAGSLNLFVWLVVGAYLIWGCRPRFRLLGLAVMPLAAAALRRRAGRRRHRRRCELRLRQPLPRAARRARARRVRRLHARGRVSPGSTSGRSRALKRRAADILRLRLPPLASLERLTWRTIAVSLPLLTLGLAAGIIRQRRDGGSLDALEAVTLLTWLVYSAFLVSRPSGRARRVPRARRLRARDRRAARARGEPLHMTLALVGLSHHVAPVELRERVTLDLPRAAALARELGDAVCLSTCNRTELYLVGDDEAAAVAALEQLAGESLDGTLYRLHEEAAALHLFRVAAGLDSLVPGEGEILGQVRAAYEAASPGPLLDRVFRQALARRQARAHRDGDRREPRVGLVGGRGARARRSSASSAGRRVLLIGAGRIGELAAANLASRGAEIAFVANRSPDAARALAARFGGEALALDEIGARLGEVDVVVSSTSAPEQVVRAARRARSAPQSALLHRHRRAARPRPRDRRARRLLPLRHRRPRSRRRRDARRAPRRGRARRAARRRGGGALPRVARVPRRRAGDRVAARAGRGDPQRRARRRSRAASATTSGGRSSR